MDNTSKNDITGDRIHNKTLSEQGRKNFDNIDWGARARAEEEKSFKFSDSQKKESGSREYDAGE